MCGAASVIAHTDAETRAAMADAAAPEKPSMCFVTDPLLGKQVFGTDAPETFRSELDVAPPREFAKRHESAETRLKADAIVSSTWVACHVARVGGNVVNRQS